MQRHRGTKIINLILDLAGIVLVIYLLFSQIFMINVIVGTSMSPTLSGVAIGNRLAYNRRSPKRGDIIIFRHDGNFLVKRVIGLPGEKVRIWGGAVFINGKVLKEDYLKDSVLTDGNKEYKVPTGSYFVLGDNREGSIDSRYFSYSYVSRNAIASRVFLDIGIGSKPKVF